jgi:hypothetical protein
MVGKKVWIVGAGLVVVIGVVAYVSNNSVPAGKDAAGTIVEVSRTHTDSTPPVATADQAAIPAPATTTPDAAAAADAAKGEAGGSASAAADAADAAGGNGMMAHAAAHAANHAADHSTNHSIDRAATR